MNWLVLDIGNTHTVAGLYPRPVQALTLGSPLPTATALVRFRTDHHATSDEYRMFLEQLFSSQGIPNLWQRSERLIVSTVVPALEAVIHQAAGSTPFLSIRSQSKRDFELDLPIPESLGADRLANAAGAYLLAEGPLLIVDAGTATTFCLLDRDRKYFGGAITPGLEISWKALQTRAAKLFAVELNQPKTSIGNTTETQLQSGVLLGYEALIEGLTDRLIRDARQSRPGFESATLIGTGGCLNGLKLSSRFKIVPDLTLYGLLRYGQLNPIAESSRV